MKKLLILSLLISSVNIAIAEHVYPTNPDPNNKEFFGKMTRDDLVVTNRITDYTTTNAVCNIVTNDVGGFSAWTVGNVRDLRPESVLCVTNLGVRYQDGYWQMRVAGTYWSGTYEDNWLFCAEDEGQFYTNKNAVYIREMWVFSTGLTSTRTFTPISNALGLAYQRDVPSTNSLISRAEANDKFLENKYLDSWQVKSFSWLENDLCFFANLVAEGWNQYQITTSEGHKDLTTYLKSCEWAGTNKTLTDYGITDAKIENGTITLGSNTITPLTSQTKANWAETNTSSAAYIQNKPSVVTYASDAPNAHKTAAGILTAAENTAGTIASNLVDHTNVRFSNEVLAVGLGIGTNEVAQINAILTDMGETPIGEATTIGALLAALAAAVAWIKKKSVKKDSNGYYFED